MADLEQSAELLFAEVLDLPPERRGAFLDRACHGAPELRGLVEKLLREHQRLGSFLAEPLFDRTSPVSSVTPAISRELGAGTKLGRYSIIEPLGSGGMGVVYRARDEKLERAVAIKILAPGAFSGDDARRRFHKEALALAKLSHPHIAAVYDVGEQDGIDYIVMECVPGESLATKLKSGPLTLKDATSIILQIAEALEEAHEQGVIHRDLKPANVMITPKGQAKVLDFGLAKLLAAVATDPTVSMRETRGIIGTPLYMSPEQAQGKKSRRANRSVEPRRHLLRIADRPRTLPRRQRPRRSARDHRRRARAAAPASARYTGTRGKDRVPVPGEGPRAPLPVGLGDRSRRVGSSVPAELLVGWRRRSRRGG